MTMIEINAMAPVLADRLRAIDDALSNQLLDPDERQDLKAEQDIKRDLLMRMLEAARPIKRRRKEPAT